MPERAVLIVFAKPPVPGLAKTRLSPPLSPEQAAAVHEASLKDVVAQARRTGLDVELQYAGSDEDAVFFNRSFPDLPSRPQSNGDLGRRMGEAFAGAFGRGALRVIIVGSDSPTLPSGELAAAAREARPDTVVLGPAADGGYYLACVHADAWPRARTMFRHVPWSTEHVLSTTVARLSASGLGVELLTPWYDIDRMEDLRVAAKHAAPGSHLGDLLGRPAFAELLRRTAGDVAPS